MAANLKHTQSVCVQSDKLCRSMVANWKHNQSVWAQSDRCGARYPLTTVNEMDPFPLQCQIGVTMTIESNP